MQWPETPLRLVWFLGAVSALGILTWGSPLSAQQEERTSGSAQLYSSRPTLRWDRPQYRNYAYQNFSNYPNHAFPFTDSKRTYYGPMGDYLVAGYDLYKWEERRTPGQEYGSSIFKPNIGENLQWERSTTRWCCFATATGIGVTASSSVTI